MNKSSLFIVRNIWWLVPILIIIFFWEHSSPIILMLIFAFLGTVSLSPIINKVDKVIRHYRISVMIIILLSFIFLILLSSFLIPIINDQLRTLQLSLNANSFSILQFKINAIAENILPTFLYNFFDNIMVKASSEYSSFWEMGLIQIKSFLNGASSLLFALGSAFLTFLIIIVFMVIFLIDGKKFTKLFLHAVPIKYYSSAKLILAQISIQLYSYIRGQLLAAISVALTSIIGLLLIQWITGIYIPYTILIGFAAGLFNLIPFVGPIAGMLPAIIIYLLTDQIIPVHIFYVLAIIGIFAIVQLIDNLIVSPYIMGGSIGFHPILVIILILFGASIGGIIGMLFIIPSAAILRVILVEIVKNLEK